MVSDASAAAIIRGIERDGPTLLADVRAVFEEKGNPERIKSEDLDVALRGLPERPRESMPKDGKAITAAKARADADTLRGEGGNAPVRRWQGREELQARGVCGCVERLPSRRGRESNR